MDPSYSPNSQGNTPMSSAPAFQQAPISSGTGDVVLSTGGRSKKPLIIGGVLALVVAIVCGVVAVLMLSGSNKTAEEEYADIYETFVESSADIDDVLSFLEKKNNKGESFIDFYYECKENTFSRYKENIDEYIGAIGKPSYRKVSADVSGLVDPFLKSGAPVFLGRVSESLDKIITLCSYALGEDNSENVLNEYDGLEPLFSLGAQYLSIKTRYDEQCLDENAEACNELDAQMRNIRKTIKSDNTMKDVFGIIVGNDYEVEYGNYRRSVNEIVNTVFGYIHNKQEEGGE